MKIALFPGSFDPITKGHQSIVNRALPLFDKIIIGIGYNSTKKTLFSLEERKKWAELTFKNNPKIEVSTYEGLTVNYCKEVNAKYILRGLRNVNDFTFENNIAMMNMDMDNAVETIFLCTIPKFSAINSSIVRDIILNKGNASQFIPEEIKQYFC